MERNLERLADLNRQRLGVVTQDQLVSCGFSPSAIRANLDAGRWQRLHPRIYLLHTGAPTWPARAWAALSYCGDPSLLSHAAAAYVRGWSEQAPAVIDVTVPYWRKARPQPGVNVHRSRAFLHIGDDSRLPPRTTASRTVVDQLRGCSSAEEATSHVLEAIRRRHTSAEILTRELAVDTRVKWRVVANSAAEFAGDGLHSVLEVAYAEIEAIHGLPAGRRQKRVTFNGRSEFQDVSYDPYGLIVELDGRIGHESIRGSLRDMRRDNRNTMSGRPTLRFGYQDVIHQGCSVARQVGTLLRNSGWNGDFTHCGL